LGSLAIALFALLPLRVSFIAVGQGDAALVTSPTGRTVLVDGGPAEAARSLERIVRAQVKKGPLDLVLLSHRHADHLGGLERLLAALGARELIDSGYPHESPAWTSLRRLLDARHVAVSEAQAGRRIALGDGATLELLGPPAPPFEHSRSNVNANSVVARLDWRHASVLFTGDAEAVTERWLLRQRAPLRARVLKVAHHGSNLSSTMRFLRAVQPEAAVISVGLVNEYRHPHPATLARLRAVGAQIFRTDEDGTVSLESDGERITLTRAHPLKASR
jgi:competence protein ComEC